MGYKHQHTLTKKGYDHKNQLQHNKRIQKQYLNNYLSMDHRMQRYLSKLLLKLISQSQSEEQSRMLTKYYLDPQCKKPIPVTSQQNRYLFMVDVDKTVSYRIEPRQDRRFRERAMYFVRMGDDIGSGVDEYYQRMIRFDYAGGYSFDRQQDQLQQEQQQEQQEQEQLNYRLEQEQLNYRLGQEQLNYRLEQEQLNYRLGQEQLNYRLEQEPMRVFQLPVMHQFLMPMDPIQNSVDNQVQGSQLESQVESQMIPPLTNRSQRERNDL